MAFWTLFGTSNQLLAALTLIAITVWLKRQGRPTWFTWTPMCFVLAITVWALVLQARAGFIGFGEAGSMLPLVNACVALALLCLAALVVLEAVRVLMQDRERRVAPARA